MNGSQPKLPEKVFKKSVVYLLAGLGFVAALAWNDAAQGLFNEIFGAARSSLFAKFGYAILITVIVTIISWKVGREVEPK